MHISKIRNIRLETKVISIAYDNFFINPLFIKGWGGANHIGAPKSAPFKIENSVLIEINNFT